MAVEIKFCGMTREEDVATAADLGAAYVGVIFAGGPRHLTVERARAVLSATPRTVQRVGVFGDQTAPEIVDAARTLDLDVVQLHGGSAGAAAQLHRITDASIWLVVRVEGSTLPEDMADQAAHADALLIDARVGGSLLGGTGVALPWHELAPSLARHRDRPLVLAGGLRPENVGRAIEALSPDVVDVSSGVEASPGIKDPARMRAFRDAVRMAERG